jgi:hypothetical protein
MVDALEEAPFVTTTEPGVADATVLECVIAGVCSPWAFAAEESVTELVP